MLFLPPSLLSWWLGHQKIIDHTWALGTAITFCIHSICLKVQMNWIPLAKHPASHKFYGHVNLLCFLTNLSVLCYVLKVFRRIIPVGLFTMLWSTGCLPFSADCEIQLIASYESILFVEIAAVGEQCFFWWELLCALVLWSSCFLPTEDTPQPDKGILFTSLFQKIFLGFLCLSKETPKFQGVGESIILQKKPEVTSAHAVS